MISNRWVFPAALLFVSLISPLVVILIRPYRITVRFGLDAVGWCLLILAALEPFTAGARLCTSFLPTP